MLHLTTRVLTRWQAAGLHLVASLTLAMLAALLIFGIWYPQPYTAAAGADRLVMLLIGIDLVLGPLCTLIVYRHGKKGLAFDIAFIAVVQLAALIYGLAVIAQSRPIFVVVSKDMTYLTMASSVDDADLAAALSAPLRTRSWIGPQQVAAPAPEDAKTREELMDSGLAGKDIDRLPKYFRAMNDAGLQLIANSAPFQQLIDHPQTQAAAQAFATRAGAPVENLRFQPLRGRDPEKDMTIVYAVGNSAPVGVIDIDPWPALN